MGFFNESAANVLPLKFLLLLTQVLLLVLVIIGKENHIWWPLGQVDYAKATRQYIAADRTLVGLAACWIAICAFEFFMLICGSSVPAFLLQVNFLQIIIQFMGVLFTTWFLLDTWRYTLMWVLWAVFALPAFALELFSIQQSIKLRTDIKKNQRGESRAL